MRILYFSREYTTHDRRFLGKLAQSRHEVFFLRLEKDGIAYENRPLPDGIHPVIWNGGRQRHNTIEAWLRLMPDFEAVLDTIHPDLVHAGPVQSCGFMTAVAGFRPFLLVSWGSDILVDADRDELWRWMTKYAISHSDRLLCDCQAVKDKVQQIMPYSDECIVQFPWGINLRQFTPRAAYQRPQCPAHWDDSFVIISTRSWEDIYGVDILVEAFRQAYRINSKLRLLLLGDGSHAAKIKQFIANHNLNEVILCPGMASHVHLPDYFRSAELYLSCTYSDGASISMLEAMASGLPIVVADTPGNREWVKPSENGWLVAAGDPEAFAKSLLFAADMKKSEFDQIGQRNRLVAEERANWDMNFSKLLEAYDQIEAKYVR